MNANPDLSGTAGKSEVGCGGEHQAKTSLSVDEARLAAVHASRAILESESIHLLEATARILAKPIAAPADLPWFDHSAMDGYAVRTTDFVGPGP
ncbi:molybdopterin biosynthesis enzyme [Ensifer sp. 4252]